MITWVPDANTAPAPSPWTMRLIAALLILFTVVGLVLLRPRQMVTVADLGRAVAHQCLMDGTAGSAEWLACVHTQSAEVVAAARESGRDLWAPDATRNGWYVVPWGTAPALVESAAHDVTEVR